MGQLIEMKVEKDIIQATLKQKNTIIHFYHPDFRRCKVMDSHLEKLASKYHKTRFIKVDVVNVPFLVVKLEIKVLPCVITFVDGITRDKIVGFETIGSGDSDNFTTSQLEERLAQSEVITLPRKEGAISRPAF
ncbi:thioredoxin-like protein [Cystobasidium minutum MCA 4210]|uniref:thioredoxin-like protein n=1 Tax=Cystobasidium minutum MCA 4210 TaxID=1397322 RepID=UPI0034CEBB07|eukprot:jgi/Rhomi1/65176/CE65175_143